MLYIVSDRHKDQACPGKDPELMKKMALTFSKANLTKKNIKMIDGFIDHDCVLQTGRDHLCLFIVESDLEPSALSEIFKPMMVEVKSAIRWQGFESKIKHTKIA
jgi:hypothetical protein